MAVPAAALFVECGGDSADESAPRNEGGISVETGGSGGSGGGESGGSGGGESGSSSGEPTGDTTSGGTEGTDGVPSDGPSINDLGTSCDGGCPDGLTAVEYCGIGGCEVGTFCSCEIRCTLGDASCCPDGATCVAVDDGPGEVCMRDRCSSSAECGSAACCGVCGSHPCSGECWDVSDGVPCRDGQMEL